VTVDTGHNSNAVVRESEAFESRQQHQRSRQFYNVIVRSDEIAKTFKGRNSFWKCADEVTTNIEALESCNFEN
jgi:hypothetical protein